MENCCCCLRLRVRLLLLGCRPTQTTCLQLEAK
jgi:hypothetical protein